MSRLDYKRPSGAGTWSVCWGYAALCESIGAALSSGDDDDEADTEVREDGTACHWLAFEVWEGRPHSIGHLSPNNRLLTEEMYDAVDVYHGVLNSWPNVAPVLEKTIPTSIPGVRDGTPDAWAYDPSTATLYVGDLKFGFAFVEVWENKQLIIYALNIIKMLGISGLVKKIVLTIVQPRSYHREGPVRSWVTTEQELEVFHLSLIEAAREGDGPNPMCRVNPGCKHCPARFGCSTLAASALDAVHQSYSATPHVLSEVGLGNELRLLRDAMRKMEARMTGLEQQAEFAMRNKKRVPGFVMKSKQGRRTWRPEFKDGMVGLGAMYSVDLAKPAEPITPAKAKAAGLPSAVVEMMSYTPNTALSLMEEDKFEVAKQVAKFNGSNTQ